MQVISSGSLGVSRSYSFHELRQVKVVSDPRQIDTVSALEQSNVLAAVIKELAANATSQTEPQVHIVTGQMGAGKSTVINNISGNLNNNCVIVDYDDLKRFVPGYTEEARKGYPGTVPGCKEMARYLEAGVKSHGFDNRMNMVVQQSIGSNDDGMLRLVGASRDNNYRVVLNILAVDKPVSTMGILSRYESGLKDIREGADALNGARRTPMEYHEDAYGCLTDPGKYKMLVPGLDEVLVLGRGGEIYYHATTNISPDDIVAAIKQGRANGNIEPVRLFEKLSSLVEFNSQFRNPELRAVKS